MCENSFSISFPKDIRIILKNKLYNTIGDIYTYFGHRFDSKTFFVIKNINKFILKILTNYHLSHFFCIKWTGINKSMGV